MGGGVRHWYCAWATQRFFRGNIATVTSCGEDCVRVNRSAIWTTNLPFRRRSRCRSTYRPVFFQNPNKPYTYMPWDFPHGVTTKWPLPKNNQKIKILIKKRILKTGSCRWLSGKESNSNSQGQGLVPYCCKFLKSLEMLVLKKIVWCFLSLCLFWWKKLSKMVQVSDVRQLTTNQLTAN